MDFVGKEDDRFKEKWRFYGRYLFWEAYFDISCLGISSNPEKLKDFMEEDDRLNKNGDFDG